MDTYSTMATCSGSGVAFLLDYSPWPIVGNHFQAPSVKPWIAWEKWAKHYDSPMLTLWIGCSLRIILSDAWVASDLLEKRSDIFSSRPRFIVMGDVINTTKTRLTNL